MEALTDNNCCIAIKAVRWRSVMGKLALSVAICGFFLNTVIASPWNEFSGFNQLTNINRKVQAAMSIVSIGSGGLMVFMGVWAKTKEQWRLTAVIGFIAWCSSTVYVGYETEWNKDTSPVWFLIFGWAGVGCYMKFRIDIFEEFQGENCFFVQRNSKFPYFAATILSIMADKNTESCDVTSEIAV